MGQAGDGLLSPRVFNQLMPGVRVTARWLAVVAAAAAVGAVARAGDLTPPAKLTLYAGTRARAKIGSDLLRGHEMLAQQMSEHDVAAALPNLRFSAQGVELDVRLSQLTPDLVARIQAMGFTVRRAHYRAAQLALAGPPERLEQLAALPEVSAIHPRYRPRLRAGAVADQADVTTGAAAARAAFGVDGTGVGVGILSDSFNDRIGGQISGSGCTRMLTGSAPQTTGDLPAQVAVLDSGPGGGTDEGAAMAELVHDLAPGADILFQTVGMDEADFADGVDALVGCGASVLVDDVGFLTEPMFQDGVVAQAMARAVAAGVPVFSAAGNEATFGVLQTFVDPDPASEMLDTPTGVDFNDFGGGNRFASVTIPPRCGITAVLQWNEPFSGALGPGATTDLDLYFYDQASASSRILTSSVDSQGCSSRTVGPAGDPLEVATFVNDAALSRTVYIAVDNFCGADAVTFRLVTFPERECNFPGAYVFDRSVFHGPQLYGHPATEGVVAVAAIDYRELDTGGAVTGSPGQIDVEPFTSLGGDLPYFFDATGNALPGGPEYRVKPDVTAPDGTNTTFFGTDRPDDADNWPNFFGTSAAAPHAAAIAALMRQAKPALAPADVQRILMDTARDIETPGQDPLSGAGEVEALPALQEALAASPPAATLTASPTSTATASPTPTAPPSPTATIATATGFCTRNGTVTVADLVVGVRIALGDAPLSDCPPLDRNGDQRISIEELIAATAAALAAA